MSENERGHRANGAPEKPNPFLRGHDTGAVAAPLQATIVRRLEVALSRLPEIKQPGSHKTHARAGVIFLLLAFHADSKTGKVSRSASRIAEEVGCSTRQVEGCLALLIQLDLITRVPGRRVRGRWPVNSYIVNAPVRNGLRTATDRGPQPSDDRPHPAADGPSAIPRADRPQPAAGYPGKAIRGTASGPSNRVARERAREDDQGNQQGTSPQVNGNGRADVNGNGAPQESSGITAERNSLRTEEDYGRSEPDVQPILTDAMVRAALTDVPLREVETTAARLLGFGVRDLWREGFRFTDGQITSAPDWHKSTTTQGAIQ